MSGTTKSKNSKPSKSTGTSSKNSQPAFDLESFFRELFYTKGKLFEMDVRRELEGQGEGEGEEGQEGEGQGEGATQARRRRSKGTSQAKQRRSKGSKSQQPFDYQIAKALLDAIIKMGEGVQGEQGESDGEQCDCGGECESGCKCGKRGKSIESEQDSGEGESEPEGEPEKEEPGEIDPDSSDQVDLTQISFEPMDPPDLGEIPKGLLYKQIKNVICRKLVKPQSFYREPGQGAMRNKPLIARHLAARQPQQLPNDTLKYKSFPVNFYFDIHQWGVSSRTWQFKIMSEMINSELTVWLGSTGHVSHILHVTRPVTLTNTQIEQLFQAFQQARDREGKMLDFSMFGLRFTGLEWCTLETLIKREKITKLVTFTDYHSLNELAKIPEYVECYWVPGRCTVNCDHLQHDKAMRAEVYRCFKGVFVDAWDDRSLLTYFQKMQPVYEVERKRSLEKLKQTTLRGE